MFSFSRRRNLSVCPHWTRCWDLLFHLTRLNSFQAPPVSIIGFGIWLTQWKWLKIMILSKCNSWLTCVCVLCACTIVWSLGLGLVFGDSGCIAITESLLHAEHMRDFILAITFLYRVGGCWSRVWHGGTDCAEGMDCIVHGSGVLTHLLYLPCVLCNYSQQHRIAPIYSLLCL